MKRIRITARNNGRLTWAYYREMDLGIPDEVILYPVGDENLSENWASSTTRPDSYAYTHGGCLYRAAVDRAKEILGKRNG